MGRKTKVAITVGAAGLTAWAASKVVAKPKPRSPKQSLEFKNPVVLSNRGGMINAPEHTLAAFSKSAELGVNGFAIDIRLTKDEEIIVFHDETADRTTDFSGKISEYTLDELKNADAGYMFVDDEGNYPYRDKGEKIITLRELLHAYPQMLIAINLKDSPDTYEGSLMPSKLWRLLEETGAEDRVIVISSFDEQTDRFNLYAQNKVATGAGNDEVRKAYAAYSSKFGHLYNPRADLFCIPEKLGVFPMNTESFINFLSSLNVAVYYNDVKDKETIERLLSIGAAGFVTDVPELVTEIIQHHSD
ncbi:glycerophosphodiester phosphodiesterase [Sporosarcina thermotolerans]|uniref:Glycerophosphodiester phosphodiesterase n=1 Tax=Sporosarcina thermotolerans TaxID=633404 RepID=A0AAW9A496_9BACL|nr:glycerophosphodiester phosphodiesterase [Sporosarcina thermotolerans]MDW0115842.1 glycerophosphodiester phosphodiesterase [Sporosarcina thermotolerans]WHT46926.1 glycerophosphodiester phosphodiesterase [Sporosarcina thermotolerans]